MKRIILIFSIIIFLSVTSPVYAALGFFKPDSRLYFFQPVFESTRLFFTFSKPAKVNYLLELAQRRIDEMNMVFSEKIANRYTTHFQQLEKIAGQTKVEKQVEVVQKIKEASLRQQEVLAKIYNLVSAQAREVVLGAQESSSKHVARTIEGIEGEEEAGNYAAWAAAIQQIGQSGQIEKLEQIQPVPREGAPSADPSQTIPKTLQPAKELKSGQELKSLNPVFEDQNPGTGGQIVQPVQPVTQQIPAEKK